jgi:hypothetical protein
VLPKPVGHSERVDAGGRPPCRLITLSVNLTMVGAAQRHRILVADFAAQGPRLHEAQVMRLGGLPLAPKAWLRRHELQMGAIAVAARLAQRQGALFDMPDNGVVYWWHFGLRLHPRLIQRSRLGQSGRRLLARLPLASAPIRWEGRFRGCTELRARSQSGHELGTAWRLAGFGDCRHPQ